jgi:hypothetical protein
MCHPRFLKKINKRKGMGGGTKKAIPENGSVGGGSEFIYLNKIKMEGYSTITASRL